MESLAPSQFSALVEGQRDVAEFQEITEETLYLLTEHNDRLLFLNYCGYVMTYQSLLKPDERISAVQVFLSEHHETPMKLRESLAGFGEAALLLVVDELIAGNQIGVTKLQEALTFIQISEEWLKNRQALQEHVSYYLAHTGYCEHCRLLICGLFEICELEETILYLLSQPGCRIMQNMHKNEGIFEKVAFMMMEIADTRAFDSCVDNLYFLMENPLPEKYGTLHAALLRAFAMATSSESCILRRNAARLLQHFPLSNGDANSTLAELSFLERALCDDFVEVRREASAECSHVIIACGESPPQGSLQRLLANCFDNLASVRLAAIRSFLSLLTDGNEAAIELAVTNSTQFKSLMNDSASVSAVATRIYAYLLEIGKLKPDQHIFHYLNNARLGLKLTMAAIFPGGPSAFVSQPEECYQQLFLSCRACPELVLTVLNSYVDIAISNFSNKEVAILASICAVSVAVYIESKVDGLLEIIAVISQEVMRHRAAKNMSRSAEDVLREAFDHIFAAISNTNFVELISKLFTERKTVFSVVINLILKGLGIKTLCTPESVLQCKLRLADDEIHTLSRLNFAEFFIDIKDASLEEYIACVRRILGIAEEQGEPEYDENPEVTRLLKRASAYQEVRISVWEMISFLVEFVDQDIEAERANRCILLMPYVDLEADPHADDAAILLSIIIDIYLNIRHFGLSADTSIALSQYIEELKGRSFSNAIVALAVKRVHKSVEINLSELSEQQKSCVLPLLQQND